MLLPQRPQIGGLDTDAARHHQRNGFDWWQDVEQNAAGDGREGEAGKARDKAAREHSGTQQQEGSDVAHEQSPLVRGEGDGSPVRKG